MARISRAMSQPRQPIQTRIKVQGSTPATWKACGIARTPAPITLFMRKQYVVQYPSSSPGIQANIEMVLKREVNAYCFFMNGLIGVSLLVIPAAVQQASFVGSLLVLLYLTCANWLTHLELLEITERLSLSAPIADTLIKEDALLKSPYQWDLPLIVYLKLGRVCGAICSLFFAAHALGGMAVYVSVFGRLLSTIAGCKYKCYTDSWQQLEQPGCESENVGQCLFVYHCGAAVFLCIIVFVYYKEWIRSQWMHLFMAVVQIGTIVVVFLYAFTQGSVSDFPKDRKLFWPVGDLPHVASVFIFAGIYQVYAPSVLAASTKHPNSQKKVADWIFWSTLVMYGSIGLVAVLFYKKTADFNFSNEGTSSSSWFLMTEMGVFAIADSISNSAFFGHTVSDAIFSLAYSPDKKREKANHPYMHKWLPILCEIPAFAVAFLHPNIVSPMQDTATSLCGLCGVVLTLVFIPLCHNEARRQQEVDDKLNLEVKLQGVKWLNYWVAGVTAAGFTYLFLHNMHPPSATPTEPL